MFPVVYLPEARDDIDAAYAAYEQRQAGLGDRFLDALRDRLDAIRAMPELYGVVPRDIRAATLRRFPYVVYYRFDAGTVVVIAVRHGHEDPATWQARV
jgi:plasmid stabilization system protein ParE